MTLEERQLLLMDLCARLPYKPIVHAKWSYRETNGELKHKEADRKLEINDFYSIWDVKPYLRPMSSMTNDEMVEFDRIKENPRYIPDKSGNSLLIPSYVDWLNAHHFDYHGLIEKGLALEATEGMYKK